MPKRRLTRKAQQHTSEIQSGQLRLVQHSRERAKELAVEVLVSSCAGCMVKRNESAVSTYVNEMPYQVTRQSAT